METLLLPSKNSSHDNILIFFNGWAMSWDVVSHLTSSSHYDILFVENYKNDDFSFNFTPYKKITIIAWSMGIWAAHRIIKELPISKLTKAVAIGGTPIQRDYKYGIPPDIFDATLKLLDEKNRDKFNRRMCGGKRLKHLRNCLEKRSTEEIKNELERVRDIHLTSSPHSLKREDCFWTKAIIPEKDKIYPPQNQKNYWNSLGVKTIILPNLDHYIFDNFSSWEEILEL